MKYSVWEAFSSLNTREKAVLLTPGDVREVINISNWPDTGNSGDSYEPGSRLLGLYLLLFLKLFGS
jgi:hypothetical protein